MNAYEQDLDRNDANYAALTPVSFLARTAYTWPQRIAVVHGARRYTWQETYDRSRQLASALARHGIKVGDTVAAMLSNTPEMIEAHFGVPMTGGVLNTLNTRLDAEAIAFMLDHGEAKVLLTDTEFAPVVKAALERVKRKPTVIDVADSEGPGGERLGKLEYETFIADGDPAFAWQPPADEWQAISLNYTSGTTGNPKGVVYHYRGAYLNALCNIIDWGMPRHSVYLWTLPMFHCNGWCFAWTMAANAGTNVCLRKVEAQAIFDAIREHKVTHYCGAPIVHSLLINAPESMKHGITHKVSALVAAAAPPAAVIEGMERMGFDITHVYGLTETYGPAAVCAKHGEWDSLDIGARTERNGRQGVKYTCEEGMTVMDPETMREVPWDGQTMGEIMFRGNITMKGYLKNPEGDRRGVRRRLVPLGRPRGHAARRLREDQGPQQGRHHLRRREHQLAGGRGRTVPAPGGGRRGRGRAAGSQVGRDAVRVRGAEARRVGDRRRAHRALPVAARALQGAEEGDLLRPAEDLHRQDPEVRAAREGEVDGGDRVTKSAASGAWIAATHRLSHERTISIARPPVSERAGLTRSSRETSRMCSGPPPSTGSTTMPRAWALLWRSIRCFSFAPLLLIVIAIAGPVFGEGTVRSEIFDQLDAMLGAEGASEVQGLLESARKPGEEPFRLRSSCRSTSTGRTS